MWGAPVSAVHDLDPRRDIRLIRERLALALHRDEDVQAILEDLAQRAPLALADLIVGPRAQPSAGLARASLGVIDVLEGAVSAAGLYRRLLDLAGSAQGEVLTVAASRHPAASWMVSLSRRVEGEGAGRTHLLHAAGHPAFAAACWAHAEAGHRLGLIAASAETGLPEPCGALASVGDVHGAAEAGVRALERTPDSPVVATLAATWGPDIGPILKSAVGHLRTRPSATALRNQSMGYPAIAALLDTVARGMV
jgi:hypothetical protein